MPNPNSAERTIAHRAQDVFAVAANEQVIRSIMPGANGSFAQLFGAKQVSINPSNSTVEFVSASGQKTTITFSVGQQDTTVCRVDALQNNPKVATYVDIVCNYYVGLALSGYVAKQVQFIRIGRGITYSFLAAFTGWTLWAGVSSMSADAGLSDWVLSLARLLGIGVLVVAPLAAIVPMFVMWLILELLKHLRYNKRFKVALEQLERQVAGLSVTQWSQADFEQQRPALTESVKYLGNYRYSGLFRVIDNVAGRLNRIMGVSGDEKRRRAYKYGVLDFLPYQLVQLNARTVVWVLPLGSDFAHTYIERRRAFSRSLGGEVIKLEGDFATYFTVYVASGEQVEALRLATPEVMATMIDHALPFDIEVRKSTLMLHTELKQFLDPIWVARSLTAAQRINTEIDARGDVPQAHRPLLSAYSVPLFQSQPKLTLLYAIPCLVLFTGAGFESPADEGALPLPFLIPLSICLGLLMGYLLAMMVILVLSFWHNRFSASIAGVVDVGMEP